MSIQILKKLELKQSGLLWLKINRQIGPR